MSARNFDIFNARKYGNVIVEHNQDSPKGEVIHIRLHNTVVVRWDRESGRVTLNSGGWHTLTTKTAINTALKQIPGFEGVRIFQLKGEWYLATNPVNKIDFIDCMILETRGGLVLKHK